MAIPGMIFLAQYGVSVAVGAIVAVGACVAVGGGAVVAVGSGTDVAVAATCATSPPSPSSAPQLTNMRPRTTIAVISRYVRGIVSRVSNKVKLAYISQSNHRGVILNVNDTIS